MDDKTQNQQPRVCPQDCRLCGFQQHAFCSAQMARTSFPMFDRLMERMDAMEKKFEQLIGERTETLAAPNTQPEHIIIDGGADNRPSDKHLNEKDYGL